MENKIIFIFVLLTALYLPCKGQNECSIYNDILNDIQSQVTKNKVVTITPKGGHDPVNPIFIYDNLKNKELLCFYIVKKKKEFNSATLKYWISDFFGDTTLKSKSYKNGDIDSILNCNFDVTYKYIKFDDKIDFDLNDCEHKKENEEIVTYIPAKITCSNLLLSGNIALIFVGVQIGTYRGGATYGYILKKANCHWQIDKRNIEVR
jgi:hypothetical protein